jgi:hypothetical protein
MPVKDGPSVLTSSVGFRIKAVVVVAGQLLQQASCPIASASHLTGRERRPFLHLMLCPVVKTAEMTTEMDATVGIPRRLLNSWSVRE